MIQLSETVVLALITVTTGIAVVKGKKNGFLLGGAILSWMLLFCFIFFDPSTILISGETPFMAQGLEALLTMLTIMVEIAGLYFLYQTKG
jgi:hypothetical protein